MKKERLFLWRTPEGKRGELVAQSREHARYQLASYGLLGARVVQETRLRKNVWRPQALAPILKGNWQPCFKPDYRWSAASN